MSSIINMIIISAYLHGVDPILLQSVIAVESSYKPEALGKAGEIGLMQVMPKYAKFTPKQLKEPSLNVMEGIRMLKLAQKKCKHKKDFGYLTCYNRGIRGGSLVENFKEDKYYKLVMSKYKELKGKKK